MTLPVTTNAIISRAEEWQIGFKTEPYEAAWASSGVLFLRTLEDAEEGGVAALEISPDGTSWARESAMVELPTSKEELTFLRFADVGCFMRVVVIRPSPTPGQRIIATVCLKGG